MTMMTTTTTTTPTPPPASSSSSPTSAADAIMTSSPTTKTTPIPTMTTTTTTNTSTTVTNNMGTAGRTDYTTWDRRAAELSRALDDEDIADESSSNVALGLDGRHAMSMAEADERRKAREARRARVVLDKYRRREEGVAEELVGLLGPVVRNDDDDDDDDDDNYHADANRRRGRGASSTTSMGKGPVRHVTRDMMRAGKRVLRLSDTTGPGKIPNDTRSSCVSSSGSSSSSSGSSSSSSGSSSSSPLQTPKSYADDATNDAMKIANENVNDDDNREPRIVHGIIKLVICNLHSCTVIVRCKIITGVVEISHCTDLTVIAIGDDATVVTVQADLCDGLDLQFRDTPSGKNVPRPVRDTNSGPTTTSYWGSDPGDRIYHAGVSNMRVSTYRDGYVDIDSANGRDGPVIDYRSLGAVGVGNASPEEVQFVTSVLDGELITERVLSATETRGTKAGARPMTERDLMALEEKRGKIHETMDGALKGAIRIEGGGRETPSVDEEGYAHGDEDVGDAAATGVASGDGPAPAPAADDEDVVEEFYASKTREEIDAIIECIDEQKAKGNEAFAAGEYAQALLFYTMSLDRAAELPDATIVNEILSSSTSSGAIGSVSSKHPSTPPSKIEQLYPRHIVLSNRSACFLKLGHHEKALTDGIDAERLDPMYVKGIFRKGLALHAMGRYEEAIASLASAQKIEPKNKQIKQALGFAEMRMTQEIRKRMHG
ncbi:hypothetical protein ACHAXA_003719 [Cyclostephanos tholiformis]|uniref:C-CAP/cofactor C-like domain-containing protein n=1 Tax=Cyclostephanos tholiformis TaxID=382380 RepID=A0ABD3RZC1_9STRA